MLNVDGRTVLEVACLEEKWDTVRYLVEVGAGVDVVFQGMSVPRSINNEGVTCSSQPITQTVGPLWRRPYKGSNGTCSLSSWMQTLMLRVNSLVCLSYIWLIKSWLKHSLDTGGTALIAACKAPLDVAKLLLEKGAYPQARGQGKISPLQCDSLTVSIFQGTGKGSPVFTRLAQPAGTT